MEFDIKTFFTTPPLILSPMAGVTDFAFRYLASLYGADLTVTEMISANALARNSKKTIDMLYCLPDERPRCVQLFGSDPESLALATRHPALEPFDIIDFNCGCPAPKIVKNGDGSSLMGNIELARKCIMSIVENTDKPVSVKFRKGIKNSDNYIEFGKMCEECGVSFVTLHGRTREQYYSGEVDLDAIKTLKSSLNIPVIANGDIVDIDSYKRAQTTHADGFSIGRGSLGQPFIFNTLKNVSTPTRFDVARKHLELLKLRIKDEKSLVNYYKKHLAWYTKNMVCGATLRHEILTATDITTLERCLELLK